jgi:hypothetical protein
MIVACVTENEGKRNRGSNVSSTPVQAMAVFSKDGRRIYVGQNRGLVVALDRESLQYLDALKVIQGSS